MANVAVIATGFLSILMGFLVAFLGIGGRRGTFSHRGTGTSITGNPSFILIAFGIVLILTGSLLP